MPRNKVDGKVCKEDAKMYCDAGKITTNRVHYGPNRKVVTKTSKLVKKAYRCIRTNENGRSVNVKCDPCTLKQACQCPHTKAEEERLQAVKVVIGPCHGCCDN